MKHTWFLTEGLPLLNATLSSVELFSIPLSGPEAVVSPLRSSSTEHSHSFALRLCSAVRAPSLCSSRSNLLVIEDFGGRNHNVSLIKKHISQSECVTN